MSKELHLSIRKALQADHSLLDEIRLEAFAPIFASFRKILGDEIYELAQKREDEQQGVLLASMFLQESKWELYVAEYENEVVGFVSIMKNQETAVGEIGLNAVKPSYSGRGIGTTMYNFAINEMRNAGIRVATAATGGDESHIPARRAYEKSGFNVQIPSVWLCRTL